MILYAADYTKKRTNIKFLGQEKNQITIVIDSLGPKRIMIRLYQRIITMNISRIGKDLFINVNSARRTSRRREKQRIHAPSMQAMRSLMLFLGNKSQKYPLNPTKINITIICS